MDHLQLPDEDDSKSGTTRCQVDTAAPAPFTLTAPIPYLGGSSLVDEAAIAQVGRLFSAASSLEEDAKGSAEG